MLKKWTEIENFSGLSREQIKELAESKGFPVTQIGNKTFSTRNSILRWFEQEMRRKISLNIDPENGFQDLSTPENLPNTPPFPTE